MSADLFGSRPATLAPDGEKGRVERGAFYTPDKLALAICDTAAVWTYAETTEEPLRILEPGCGGGAFLRAAAATWPKSELHGVDLVPACAGPGRVEKRDLFTLTGPYDVIVGNPDFAIAEKAVRHCMTLLAPDGLLVFLLRLAFLGSQERVALYRDFPLRYLQPIAQRPSFTADGRTDPMEYAAFAWTKFRERPLVPTSNLLQPLVWR